MVERIQRSYPGPQDLIGDEWPEEYPKIKLEVLDTGIDSTHEWVGLNSSGQELRYKDFTIVT